MPIPFVVGPNMNIHEDQHHHCCVQAYYVDEFVNFEVRVAPFSTHMHSGVLIGGTPIRTQNSIAADSIQVTAMAVT